jgi:hypothetical protein
MPQPPRTIDEQARIIKDRLADLSRSGGPLEDVDPSPTELDMSDVRELINPDLPWPVNLRTAVLTLLPSLESGTEVGE